MINCVRFLGMTDMDAIGRLTFYECDLLFTGVELRQLDREREMHWQAYLNRQVQSKKVRKDKEYWTYPNFKDFFDEDKLMARAGMSEKQERDDQAFALLLQANR